MKQLFALLWAAFVPGVLAAQVEVTPTLGLFFPTANIFQGLTLPGLAGIPGAGISPVELRPNTSALFGAKVTTWLSPSLGIEGSLAFTPNGAAGSIFDGKASENGRVFIGSGRVLLGLPVPIVSTTFHVLAGPALIKRGGTAYQGVGRTLNFGVVFGGGARIGLSKNLSVRLDVENTLWNARFENPPARLKSDTNIQNDYVVSVGMAIRVSDRQR